MWKESYKIGVALIDEQHRQLFKMVEQLLNKVQYGKGDIKNDCTTAVAYLKNYTLQHFRDEEKFQKSINYIGYEEHARAHRHLVHSVLEHERNMLVSDFNKTAIKDFIGMLIAWLVCHVAGDDQRIVSDLKNTHTGIAEAAVDTYFHKSMCEILNRAMDMEESEIKVLEGYTGGLQQTISTEFKLTGGFNGDLSLNYTEQLAFSLIESIASFVPDKIDEFVLSAMTEISDITCFEALALMSAQGLTCSFERTSTRTHPAFVPSPDSIILDTGLGLLEINTIPAQTEFAQMI